MHRFLIQLAPPYFPLLPSLIFFTWNYLSAISNIQYEGFGSEIAQKIVFGRGSRVEMKKG